MSEHEAEVKNKEIEENNKEVEENKIECVSPKAISQLSKEKEIAIGEIKDEFNVGFQSWVSEQMMEAIMNKKENRSI